MILTQIQHCTDMEINRFSKLCFMVIHRNCRSVFQAIQLQGKNHEFHATHGIKLELESVLSCSTAYSAIRETSSFDSTFPSTSNPLPSRTKVLFLQPSPTIPLAMQYHFSRCYILVPYLMQVLISRSSHPLWTYESPLRKYVRIQTLIIHKNQNRLVEVFCLVGFFFKS